ncbi:oligoendopeptidase F [Rhabdochlamydiaceae symbiont of Dictyostelium giganteum]|uniref:oligoendopeptidase F n=1 Tax=Rhabdochlamydiaceae symbiont of Dictyostelium giganteum TaxID=3342349 RepID=UPI00384EF2AE
MKREEIAKTDQWNIEAFYPTLEAWYKEFTLCEESQKKGNWQKLKERQGSIHEGAEAVLHILESYLKIEQDLARLYVYAHLRKDEDVGHTKHQEMFLQISSLCHQFKQDMSWIEPEILQMQEEELNKLLEVEELKPYHFYLTKMIRFKPHTLTPQEENLLASGSDALGVAERAFEAFNCGDLKFPSVVDSEGKSHPLTHGTYLTYLLSQDRALRQSAFETLHSTFSLWENTLCELIQGEMKKHLFLAKTRKFNSCLESALFPHHIDPSVYHNLIQVVRDALPAFHRYFALRKKVMKLDKLHLYDLKVPLITPVDMHLTFDHAVDLIIKSLAPLGKEYQDILEKGLKVDRWVDRYENDRKRTGAYSSGFYQHFPYILMNYHGQFNDMMTLTHESGHSMHSYFASLHQSYHNAQYPIFLAEVASTFHEELLSNYLLKAVTSKKQRAYLINQKIEDIRNTFFRQVMFAEFELKLHTSVEKGIPLTPSYLKKSYLELNQDYFGPDVIIDPSIEIEWARVPHFYYNFYVYQYATGLAASRTLVNLVEKEGPLGYLEFISSGGSCFPLETLKKAGVDMTTKEPLQTVLDQFTSLMTELEVLLGEEE